MTTLAFVVWHGRWLRQFLAQHYLAPAWRPVWTALGAFDDTDWTAVPRVLWLTVCAVIDSVASVVVFVARDEIMPATIRLLHTLLRADAQHLRTRMGAPWRAIRQHAEVYAVWWGYRPRVKAYADWWRLRPQWTRDGCLKMDGAAEAEIGVKLECVGGPWDGERAESDPREWRSEATLAADVRDPCPVGTPVDGKGYYRLGRWPDGTPYNQWHQTP